MSTSEPPSRTQVNLLTAYANPPREERGEQAAAEILDPWIMCANELSQQIRAAQYQGHSPVTVFDHPTSIGDSD